MENGINVATWLASVATLFQDVYDAVASVAVLRFFLVVLLFLVAVSLAAWLVRRGARQKI